MSNINSDSANAVARQGSLRSNNLSLVLRTIFASHDTLARIDVANATGMTRSTVSRLVDELVAAGMVDENDPIESHRRGRPAVPLYPGSGVLFALGLEINVGRLAARLVDLSGIVVAQGEYFEDFSELAPEVVIAKLVELANNCLDEKPEGAQIVGVHIAVPGIVSTESEEVFVAPNLGWRNVSLRELLLNSGLKITTEPVGISNEADCSAVCVTQKTPGRWSKLRDFLYVSGDIGIGSAIVINGRVASGKRGWAGEIGHFCIDAAGPKCGCGATGCLETYAGLKAILKSANQKNLGSLITALESGDTAALEAVAKASKSLGLALSGALNLLDVSTVILGGKLGSLANWLSEGINEELQKRVLTARINQPEVLTVSPDTCPPALGAAYIALFQVLLNPAEWIPETE